MNRFIAACLVPVALGGCAIKGELQGIGQQIPGAVGQFDSAVNSIILQKHADEHNLVVGLEQIDAARGMVVQITPPPIIGTPVNPGAPIAMQPAPVPTPPPIPQPPPIPSQPPSPGPGGPIVTPNRR